VQSRLASQLDRDLHVHRDADRGDRLGSGAYLSIGAIEGLDKAVYFSMVTYTTLGYGDVLLDENWRVPASYQAVNGIIMFGWTTAIIIYAIRQVYFEGHVD
jgi:hypothetical protein